MEPLNFGWLKDYPDMRDFAFDTAEPSKQAQEESNPVSIKNILKQVKIGDKPLKIPAAVDLRPYFSPVENQGTLGSCTANAGVGVLEYFERRAFGNHLNGSRLFLYKATRNLMRMTGDTGAYLRSTMGAMALFGVPLESYWPYVISQFDVEPSSFLYSMAQNYQSIQYYRLDPVGTAPATLLSRIKDHAAAGIPSMFGFTCYSSLYGAASTGKIPFPQRTESVVGGHAIVVAGYDDSIEIRNGSVTTRGAFLIRNSWGSSWGMGGYGYLPYQYVLSGLATDFWVLIKNEWIATGQFGVTS